MRSVIVTVAIGLVLISVTVVAVLARSPLTVVGTNSIPAKDYIELEKGGLSNCQSAGTLPRGTSAVRIRIEGVYFSPAVTIRLLVGSRVLREDGQVAGGLSAPTVTIAVRPLAHAVQDARICTAIGAATEPIRFYGVPGHSSTHIENPLQGASLGVEYLRDGSKSWWSMLSSVAYHMGLGRAPSGGGVVFLLLVLGLAVVATASWLLVKELR